MKIDFTASFDFKTEAALKRLNLESGGLAQQMMDSTVIRYATRYVPVRASQGGTLARSVWSETTIGSGELIWRGPYAHYMYYGQVYGPNIPVFENDSGEPTRFFSPKGKRKKPTGRKLDYSKGKNPLAGPFWIESVKANHMNEILKAVQGVVGRRD